MEALALQSPIESVPAEAVGISDVARHQSRTKVSIRPVAAALSITASGTMGPQGSVDYDITAPAWMPIKVEGTYNFITMDGVAGEVFANSVRGDIIIKGGTGTRDLSLGVPENANATFTIRTYQGSFTTDLPLAGVNRADIQRGRRVVTTLGNGSADVSLETFGGAIRIRRGTAARPRGRD